MKKKKVSYKDFATGRATPVVKEKKHRHKWVLETCDCPFCGGGSYYECECGETRDCNKKPL